MFFCLRYYYKRIADYARTHRRALPEIAEMYVASSLTVTVGSLYVTLGSPSALAGLWPYCVLAFYLIGLALTDLSQMKHVANRIHSRMHSLGLNKTQLSERCSLAALHLFEDAEAPGLTRDRISKILMNRKEVPAKSAARIITHPELKVLSTVLNVSREWLIGQKENRDPVVWNVLAQPDRVQKLTNLLREYEAVSAQTSVWSVYPMPVFVTAAFSHAFNHAFFGQKAGVGKTRPLVEFANSVDRIRRKWLLRTNRNFVYTNFIYQSDFENAICGQGILSGISRTILLRNLDVMVELTSDPALKLQLVILKDQDPTSKMSSLGNYEILAATDRVFSIWTYPNCDVGWSEHPSYVETHREILDRLPRHSLFDRPQELTEYLKALRCRIAER